MKANTPAAQNLWPKTIPDDLRRHLEGVMGYRSYGPAEVWDAVREWLEKRGIQPTPAQGSEPAGPLLSLEEMEEIEARHLCAALDRVAARRQSADHSDDASDDPSKAD